MKSEPIHRRAQSRACASNKQVRRRNATGCALICFCIPSALGQQSFPAHETGSDPPAPKRQSHGVPIGPAEIRDRGGFQSVQVNTNATGANIVGDAANETSMTVDRVRPNRIAIGWRQFDSIQSNFREAGIAWSRDGGHTWRNAGVLGSGEFRTDPVLDSDLHGNFYYHSLFGTSLRDCDVYKSSDGGVSWSAPVRAGGGDKNWLAVDRSGGTGDGNVYTVWRADFSCCGPNIFNRSTDEGATFSLPVPIPQNPALGTIAIGPEGEVYVAGVNIANRSQFFVQKSISARDPSQAIAFEQTRTVAMGGTLTFNSGSGPNPGGLCGQVWVDVDDSNGPHRGNVYLLCSVDPTGNDPQNVHFVRSSDGGATWGNPIRVDDDPAATAWQWFGTMDVAPNGRIDAVWCDTRASGQVNISEVRYSYSTDAGTTWSPSVAISAPFNSHLGWPNQNKIGDYFQLVSDNVGTSLAYAATFNGEQDVYFVRIGEFDCNGNGIADVLDIGLRVSSDLDGDEIPDDCQCLGDRDGDLTVDLNDLALVLAAFGTVVEGPGFNTAADANRDQVVSLSDLAIVLSGFGTDCP